MKKCDLCLPLVYPPPIAWVAKYFEKKSVCINDTHQYILYVWKTGRFYLSENTVHNVLLAKLNINEQISYEFLIRLIQRLIIRLIRRLAIGLMFCSISVCQIRFCGFMALIQWGGSVEVGTTGWPSRIQEARHFLC